MWRKFCSWFLCKVLGWTADGPMPEDKVCVILGVSHTSIWDMAIAYFYYTSVGGRARVMIKKEAFFWPLGPILRSMGAFPIDRGNPTGIITDLIGKMKDCEKFHLAMCPEGTRKPVKKWKTGYHTIARQVGCPVYLGYFDWKTKHIGCGKPFPLSDNARKDTEAIQQAYEQMHLTGKFPDCYTTH